MKYRNSLFLLLVVLSIRCNQPVATKSKIDSQKEINILLKNKLKTANKVLLTSHTGQVFDSINRKVISPEILEGDSINTIIIQEQKILTGKSLDTLIEVLSAQTDSADIKYYMCFDPHHTIFILHNSEVSYIDMCFHCWGLATSDDLKEIKGYDELTWRQIYLLFKRLGFKYEMPN